VIINPCLESTPRLEIATTLKTLDQLGCDFIHISVMDGHFTSKMGLDFQLCREIKKKFQFKLELRLSTTTPEQLVVQALKSGANFISFHPETTHAPLTLIQKIRRNGVRAGLVLNHNQQPYSISSMLDEIDYVTIMSCEPDSKSPVFLETTYEKISNLAWLREEGNYNFWIQVEGAVDVLNAVECKKMGADMLVVGRQALNVPKMNLYEAYQAVQHSLDGSLDVEEHS